MLVKRLARLISSCKWLHARPSVDRNSIDENFLFSSTLLASIIPIIKLGIGLYYKDQCPIDQRIPTYMIVAGIAGLAMAALAVLLAV